VETTTPTGHTYTSTAPPLPGTPFQVSAHQAEPAANKANKANEAKKVLVRRRRVQLERERIRRRKRSASRS
jgi:hypothetical protein